MKKNGRVASAVIDSLARLQEDGAARSDYLAGKSSRFIRKRTGLGGSGDAHYQSRYHFDRIREEALDMDRNDAIVGSFVDRAVSNQLQGGFRVRPMTGDPALDDELKARFDEWASDPELCDEDGESTFWEDCWTDLRSTYIAGDHFSLLTPRGTIQTLEADRCQSPGGLAVTEDLVHGVELSGRRKVAYWFSTSISNTHSDYGVGLVRRPRVVDGMPVVLQLYNPQTVRRKTQTRGVSAFAPVFTRLSQFEDIQFAKLVQQQVVSAFAWFFERDANWKGGSAMLGPQTNDSTSYPDSDSETLEEVAPGANVRGVPGEKMHALSANIPNPEYFDHVKLVLTEIGINIGVPLVMGLMDASETNFSGWRGAVTLARLGFRVNQKAFIQRKLAPVWRWKVSHWANASKRDGGLGAAAKRNPAIYRAEWIPPAWPYDIAPLQDAQANKIKLETGQTTPSRLTREIIGAEWEDQVEEGVRDYGLLIEEAAKKAAEINKKHPTANVTWRECANFAAPAGVTFAGPVDPSATSGGDTNDEPTNDDGGDDE